MLKYFVKNEFLSYSQEHKEKKKEKKRDKEKKKKNKDKDREKERKKDKEKSKEVRGFFPISILISEVYVDTRKRKYCPTKDFVLYI